MPRHLYTVQNYTNKLNLHTNSICKMYTHIGEHKVYTNILIHKAYNMRNNAYIKMII